MKTLILLLLVTACASKPKPVKPAAVVVPPPAAPIIGEVRMVDYFGAKKRFKVLRLCANPNRKVNSLIITMKPLNGKGQPIKAYEEGDTRGVEVCK